MVKPIEEAFQRSIERAVLSAASKDDDALLTEQERFALAFVARVPVATETIGTTVHYRICGLVGFAKVCGQWQVYHRRDADV
ncbi:hypothetical protein [Burkholderia sp. JKS000303]|uniref:hypothetical protein n=1 Tax=Burkholderia sp. JKS000303 TaxID=1938747 RepID=UPI000BF36B76|nr:hypothetical protein [Burkholderia sp. JKS000303]PFH29125.1 hypothetical protein BX604_2897 [Burkholderia sp. JKS000303]